MTKIFHIYCTQEVGEVPHAMLYLSDGVHVENLGLLSLLKLRIKRIINADGGSSPPKKKLELICCIP